MERKVVKVLLNDMDNVGKRKEVEVEVVRTLPTTIWVKLPDGSIVRRKKTRDMLP